MDTPPRTPLRPDTIRASEVGIFLYCRRAWWYQREGWESKNVEELHTGAQMHEAHGRKVIAIAIYRIAGYAAVLLALMLAAVAVLDRWLLLQ